LLLGPGASVRASHMVVVGAALVEQLLGSLELPCVRPTWLLEQAIIARIDLLMELLQAPIE